MKKLALAALVSAVAAPAAFAGNVAAPVIEPAPAPVTYVAPIASPWTGFYGGAQVGYGDFSAGRGWGDSDGAVYGLHAGYNYGFTNGWVLGGELTYDFSDVSGTNADRSSIDQGDSYAAKLKVGYAPANWLFYGTAGWSRTEFTVGRDDYKDNGWVAGVGADYLYDTNWVVGVEALYHDYSDFDGSRVDIDGYTLKAKLSYNF